MIYLCDFEDSFTYNIFSQMSEDYPDHEITVVEHKDILRVLKELSESVDSHVVILGPGPGHPEKHEHLIPSLKKLIEKNNIFLFGICLGHQLLGLALGLKVKHCREPIHGKTQSFNLPSKIAKEMGLPSLICVQSYNSLALVSRSDQKNPTGIKWFKEKGEIICMFGKNLRSYQFHPESIGTNNPKVFFKFLEKNFVN